MATAIGLVVGLALNAAVIAVIAGIVQYILLMFGVSHIGILNVSTGFWVLFLCVALVAMLCGVMRSR